jgi:uncharacterized protein (DUF1778 family)
MEGEIMYPEPSHGGEYARLSCRVSVRIKQKAEEAASLLGQSMTDFTEAALADKAQAVLEQHERIAVSDRDFARFVQLIEAPKPPTPRLQEAMAEYRKLKAENPESNL